MFIINNREYQKYVNTHFEDYRLKYMDNGIPLKNKIVHQLESFEQ